MHAIASGTVLITGPTGGLGKATTLALANRPTGQRPDLLLVGRPGTALAEVAASGGAALVLMHARGEQATMSGFSQYPDEAYDDMVRDVCAEWESAARSSFCRHRSCGVRWK